MKEVWRDAPGLEDRYEVSNLGRLRSKRRGLVRRPFRRYDGYHLITVKKNGLPRPVYLHRLVAEAFLPNPRRLPEVNHIDGDKSNNAASNLEWVTRSDNLRHAWATGLRAAA